MWTFHKSNLVKTMGASNKNALPKMISTYCGSVQSLAPPQFAAVRKLGFSRVISQQRVRGNWATFFKAEIWFFALLYFNKWSTILSVPGTQRTNEIFFNSKYWLSNWEYLLCLQIVHVNKPNPKKTVHTSANSRIKYALLTSILCQQLWTWLQAKPNFVCRPKKVIAFLYVFFNSHSKY